MTPEWFRRAVFYQVYPRSFADANGDGTGDLRGIIEKLDYLEWLGVNAIWLSPHYPSPKHDGGYDVADYMAVDPEYGTLDEFGDLVDQMHARDMYLVIDVVLNHTSDEHTWFEESRSSRSNPKRDWYVWHDGNEGDPPNNWQSRFGGSAWEFDDRTQAFYYHFFLKEQPDLNWRNPEVQAAMFDQIRFWFDVGVDGLRLDAIGTVFEREDLASHDSSYTAFDFLRAFWLGKQAGVSPEEVAAINASLFGGQRDLPEIQTLMEDLRRMIDDYPNRVLIGETTSPEFLGTGSNRLHAIFNFNLLGYSELSPQLVRDDQDFWLANVPPGAAYGNTLNNHDQSRVRTHYGDGESEESARIGAALVLTLVGVPFLYYGEEIGMEDYAVRSFDEVHDAVSLVYRDLMRRSGDSDSKILADLALLARDRCRTPMQWSGAENAGFSPSGVATWLPVHENHRSGTNVEAQMNTAGSLLHFYRDLIRFRRGSTALTSGDYEGIETDGERYLAFRRSAPDETLLVLINFTGTDQTVEHDTNGMRMRFSSHAPGGVLQHTTKLRPFEVLIAETTSSSHNRH